MKLSFVFDSDGPQYTGSTVGGTFQPLARRHLHATIMPLACITYWDMQFSHWLPAISDLYRRFFCPTSATARRFATPTTART
jgi:hypothetical protein